MNIHDNTASLQTLVDILKNKGFYSGDKEGKEAFEEGMNSGDFQEITEEEYESTQDTETEPEI